MNPTAAMNDVLDRLTKERDGLGRALTFKSRECDLNGQLYEAAISFFPEEMVRAFEETPEFQAIEREAKALWSEAAALEGSQTSQETP